ncbi:MAG TPA: dGTPase, partial [Chryseolinea sp.]
MGQKGSAPTHQSRSAFEQDYDRIIFSQPFRRLQDKTQVHPLPEHDFV